MSVFKRACRKRENGYSTGVSPLGEKILSLLFTVVRRKTAGLTL